MNPTTPPGPAPSAPPEIFRERRERLLARTGGAVTVLGAAPELRRSRDTDIRYRPASDLYYLTGVDEPDALAVLTPHDPAHRFTLFVRPRNPEREVWNGPRVGVEGAAERFGADAVYPIGEADERLPDLLRPADRVLLTLGLDPELDARVAELILAFRRTRQRSGVGPAVIEDAEAVLGAMRRRKDDHELERMRSAATIAVAGQRAAMRAARPGAGEWELEAAVESTFRALGAVGAAFPSIIGSGPNATVLHYTSNDRRIRDGDLVLVDAGAEWGMYASDMTRTFPANGRFSAPQRAVYDLVLAALEAGIAAAAPGAAFAGVHDAALRVLVEGMISLGVLAREDVDAALESGAYRRFYPHSTSHWLGLDVHDVGLYREGDASVLLEPGMVLTVEPGLYFPPDAADVPEAFRGIGVRLEDSIVITRAGRENLTRGLPVDPAEVEALVGDRD
ncbi:MAG TPA: aminopeptidase P N-terminal domain-containing protein [Longimicrobiaceae bacterium]|nr:aminopeptidase P N-terminal domain-containing protein [Longimicrobiaceae bacterium]